MRSCFELGALLAAAATCAAQVVEAPPDLVPVRAYVVRAIAADLAPSLAVAVIRDGRVVWAEGFGYANVEQKVAATPDTPYLLASVTKLLTATGLMLLVERGKIDLDAPANDYLPGAKLRWPLGDADRITIRRLANHTAGLPEHWNFFYGGRQPPAIDETIRRYGFAATEPGTRWRYSNLAFAVLAHLTEVVAAEPWRSFMEREVWGPLGMTRTSDRVRPGLEAGAAIPYRPAGKGFARTGTYDFDHRGASACWSTANDLARFLRMHLGDGELDGRRFLAAETVRRMREKTSARNAVAWFIGRVRGRTAFWHSGGMPGVSTMLRGFPGTGSATIVLANTSRRTLTNEVTRRVTAALFPDGKDDPAAAPAGGRADSQAGIGRWAGRLRHFAGDLPLCVDSEGMDGILVRLGDAPATRLTGVHWDGRTLSGRFAGRVATQEGYDGPMTLELELVRDGDKMHGVLTARAPSRHALPHWVELERRR